MPHDVRAVFDAVVEDVPPPGTRRKRIPDDRLLDAARREFAERGYQSARVDAIATNANVTKATLYARLGSKLEMFEAALRRDTAALQQTLLAAYQRLDGASYARRIHGYVEAYFTFALTQPVAFRLLFVVDGEAGAVRARFDLESVITERIAEIIAGDLASSEVEPVHRLLAALVVGATHHGAGAAAATGVTPSLAADITENFLAAAFRGLDTALLTAEETP